MAERPPAPSRRQRRRPSPEAGDEKIRRAMDDALKWMQYIGGGFALLGVLGFLVALVSAEFLGHGWRTTVAAVGIGGGFGFLVLGGTVFAIGHTFRR